MAEVLAPSLLERPRLLRAEEFERLLKTGVFADEHVELIHGRIVLLMAQGPDHVGVLNWLSTLLTRRLVKEYGPEQERAVVQMQSSARFAPGSTPEADLTVPESDLMLVPAASAFKGGPYDPAETMLVAEVSDTTLTHDLAEKSRLYAALAVPLVWVVDLPNRRLHVLQRPDPQTATYAEAAVFSGDETVGLPALPEMEPIRAGELFVHLDAE